MRSPRLQAWRLAPRSPAIRHPDAVQQLKYSSMIGPATISAIAVPFAGIETTRPPIPFCHRRADLNEGRVRIRLAEVRSQVAYEALQRMRRDHACHCSACSSTLSVADSIASRAAFTVVVSIQGSLTPSVGRVRRRGQAMRSPPRHQSPFAPFGGAEKDHNSALCGANA